MERFMNAQKDSSIRYMFLGTVLALGFIWLNTFAYRNSFEELVEAFGMFLVLLVTAGGTFFCYRVLNEERYMEDEDTLDDTGTSCVFVAIYGILMLIAFLLEVKTDSFSFYGKEDVIVWSVVIPKKFLYDVCAIVMFPISIQMVFREMQKGKFSRKAIIFGVISVLGLTIEGSLIFMAMSNVWLVDLAILNTATLAAAIWKYVLPEKYIHKKNIFAAVAFYVMFRILLLSIQCDGWGGKITDFMYTGEWSEYMNGIKELAKNAAFFGTSEKLLNSAYIHNWFTGRNKPVLQLLFHGGWAAVMIFILFMICFVVVLFKLLGSKNGREHRDFLMYATAAVMLTMRAVFGILYSFGVPYPIALPFGGFHAGAMDVMAFTLLLLGAWENRSIDHYRQIETKFVPAADILGAQEEYRVSDCDGEEFEKKYYDCEVDVITAEKTVHCIADRYTVYGRMFGVFKEAGPDDRRFVLEHAEEKWVPLNDPEGAILKELTEEYAYAHKPDCMEKIDHEEICEEEIFSEKQIDTEP